MCVWETIQLKQSELFCIAHCKSHSCYTEMTEAVHNEKLFNMFNWNNLNCFVLLSLIAVIGGFSIYNPYPPLPPLWKTFGIPTHFFHFVVPIPIHFKIFAGGIPTYFCPFHQNSSNFLKKLLMWLEFRHIFVFSIKNS